MGVDSSFHLPSHMKPDLPPMATFIAGKHPSRDVELGASFDNAFYHAMGPSQFALEELCGATVAAIKEEVKKKMIFTEIFKRSTKNLMYEIKTKPWRPPFKCMYILVNGYFLKHIFLGMISCERLAWDSSFLGVFSTDKQERMEQTTNFINVSQIAGLAALAVGIIYTIYWLTIKTPIYRSKAEITRENFEPHIKNANDRFVEKHLIKCLDKELKKLGM